MTIREYSLNLGLDNLPMCKDPDVLQDMYRVYNAIKLVAQALDNYTGALGAQADDYSLAGSSYVSVQNMCRFYAQASVAITAGQLLTVNSSGQLALSGIGTVQGWAPAAIAAGAYGEMRLFGMHTAVTGLTPGTWYYAASTPGGFTSTVTAQKIGFALSATRLFINPA